MQALSTKRLTDALQAGFNRCTEHGYPLSGEQQATLLQSMFEAFADEIIEDMRGASVR